MTTLQAEFVVATSFQLPGLGVLVLPTSSTPAWLADYALHTAIALTLLTEGEPPSSLIGTVEEIAHADQPTQRALLLDFAPDGILSPGTRLQAIKTQPQLQ